MDNTVSRKLIEQSHGARIKKLIWIAAFDDHSIKDILDDMDEPDIRSCFPKIDPSINDIDEFLISLAHARMQGFIAKAVFPLATNFKYDNSGSPVSWQTNNSGGRIMFFYGETTGDIITQMQAASEIQFAACVDYDKKQSKKVYSWR